MSEQLGQFVLDDDVRRCGPGGRLLIGGSPLRLIRLTEAGAALLDRLGAGAPVRSTPGARSLTDRLVDGGVLHPCPESHTGRVAADVTVVVPVRDHSASLERLLSSLARSTPRPAHVVIVDDGSADPGDVAEVVGRSSLAEVTLIRSERSQGPASARNLGARSVTTELIAFVDADCTVWEGWLGPLVAQLDVPGVGAAAPRVVAATSGSGRLLERYDAVRSPLDLGPRPARVEAGTRVSYVPSAALVARADSFEHSGGFDASMRVGEDVDLVWRLTAQGVRVRYDPRAVVAHEVRADLRSWIGQRVDYGSSAASLDRRHPGAVAPVACSPWSAAVWLLAAFGRYESAGAVVVGTMVRLRSRLVDVPVAEVVRLAARGHLGAVEQLARSTVRVWWPVALLGAIASRRARRVLVVSAAITSVVAAVRARTAIDGTGGAVQRRPSSTLVAVLALVDDVAYGAGVWRGCWRTRSWRALAPRFSSSVGRSDDSRARGPVRRTPRSAGRPR